MSTSPVGLTSFAKLLPVTGSFALPFTAYFLLLSGRVVAQRLRDGHFLGDDRTEALRVFCRCHANFAENVPLAIVLAAVAELNGGSRRVLTAAYTALFLLRVAHVELGLRRGGDAMGLGRPVGWLGTLGVIAGLAGYGAYLVRDFWEV